MDLVKVLLMLKAVYKESIIKKTLLGDDDTICYNETNPAHTLYH